MAAMLSLITVEPFLFLCMNVFFLNIFALPQVILENVCLKKHNGTKCSAMYTGFYKEDYDIVQEESSLWFGGYLVFSTFISVLSLPFIATMSDAFGRRRTMVIQPLCLLVQSIVIVCILSRGLIFPTWVMVFVGLIPGLAGDASGLYMLTCSYITRITTAKTRTLRLNLLEASSILSSFTATLSSGFIIKRFRYIGIFVACIGLETLAILYLVLFIKPIGTPKMTDEKTDMFKDETGLDCKEDQNIDIDDKDKNEKTSITQELAHQHLNSESVLENYSKEREKKQRRAEESMVYRVMLILKASNPVGSFKRVYDLLKIYKQVKYSLVLFLLLILVTITYSGELAVVVLYLKNKPYYLNSVDIGYFLAFRNASRSVLGLTGFNCILTRVLKLKDHTILVMTASTFTVYYILIGFSNSTWMLYLTQVILALSAPNVPTIHAMITKLIPPSKVDTILAGTLILETIAFLLGSTVGPLVYYGFASVHAGSVFFLDALFMFVTLCMSLSLFLINHFKSKRQAETKTPDTAAQLLGETELNVNS
ncbi:uncharacterized protein LOC135696078 [Rhopilema esculentum]|uniref:uncharacterized protein LOC135696078 n=1 Tax=Rhopilema esculentum TaxID=499914 RepID=UPI0031DEA046